jgi:hypothetical protein
MRGESYQVNNNLFFGKIMEGFGDNFKIVSVKLNKELVAATAFLWNQKT